MKPRTVTVYAPASISNLGPGFDVLGIAIDRPGDYVTASRTKKEGVGFSLRTPREGIPGSASRNVAAHVASLLLDEVNPGFGVKLMLDKRMPLGSGLGSSAASSAAAALAVNSLLDKPLAKRDLLRFVVEGERMAAGSPHADNAAPSLLGGAWLIRSYDPLDVIPIPFRNGIIWVVVHPHLVVHTRRARKVLPATVSLRTAVHQWGNVSGVTVGLISGDAALLGKCTEDVIVEPVRSRLIPGFHEAKAAALGAGAAGCSISGSGPSAFAVTSSVASARRIAGAMAEAFLHAAEAKSESYISRINPKGACVVRMKPR